MLTDSTKLGLIMMVLMSLSYCKADGDITHERERTIVVSMLQDIARDLDAMGFPVDLDEVEVEIYEPSEMALLFSKIDSQSRKEVKPMTHFAPKIDSVLSDEEDEVSNSEGRMAFYDPNSKTIVLKKNASFKLSKGYLAHELAHAYQDQRFGFRNIWQPYTNNPSHELFNITQYIIEGHAELIRQTYEQLQAKNKRTVSFMSATLGKFAETECVECFSVKSLVNLPYSLGLRFLVHQFRDGGWPLVESYFTNLPTSTEQIIHPTKLKLDEPQTIDLPVFTDPNIKTQVLLDSSLGEAFLLSKLLSLSVPVKEAFFAASGFDGDEAHLYSAFDGSEALVWRIVFDRALDAEQLESSIDKLNKPFTIVRTGPVIDWIISDSEDLKNKLRIFLSKNPQTIEDDPIAESTTKEQELIMKNERGMLINPFYD